MRRDVKLDLVPDTKPPVDPSKAYILLRLTDAQELAALLPLEHPMRTNLLGETGGDFGEIAEQLKGVHSWVQDHGGDPVCNALAVQKLGRRLRRLIDRADERQPQNAKTAQPKPGGDD